MLFAFLYFARVCEQQNDKKALNMEIGVPVEISE